MSRSSYRALAQARAALAEIIRERGWTLFGYYPDKSDAMTDYFSPASWEGVATKGDAVLVVGAPVDRSGYAPETEVYGTITCLDCAGTLRTTRQTFQTILTGRAFLGGLCPEVTSVERPLGSPCTCKDGKETGIVAREAGPVWPTYVERDPERTRESWHIERGGKIVASSGAGLAAAHKAKKLKEVAAEIDAAIEPPESSPTAPERGRALALSNRPAWLAEAAVTVSTVRPDYVEIRFPRKPDEATRTRLKEVLCFKWARSTQCWFGPADRLQVVRDCGPAEIHAEPVAAPAEEAAPGRVVGFQLRRPLTLAQGREASAIEAHHGIPADSGDTEVPWPAD